MQVRILPFGVLKDWLSPGGCELPDGATVAMLLDRLPAANPALPARVLEGIAVSVNAEFATPATILHNGDEVGLLPPVSGGTAQGPDNAQPESEAAIFLTRDPIDAAALAANAKAGEDGAVVMFDGIVRNNSRGRRTLFLDYEAYEEMALRQMRELARDARARFAVRHVSVVHRLGRLKVGETSVLIVVASAHRAPAFEASRWLIDTLKRTVPIWKKETFEDGAVWTDGEPFPDGIAIRPAEADHAS